MLAATVAPDAGRGHFVFIISNSAPVYAPPTTAPTNAVFAYSFSDQDGYSEKSLLYTGLTTDPHGHGGGH